MALEDIIEKIIKDAEGKAKEIRDNANLDSQAILSKAKSEIESLEKEILKENQKKKNIEVGRIMVKANLERKNRLLKARRSLVEECFKKAEEEFLNSDIDILKGFFKRAILESAKEGIEEVVISERYKGIITEEFLKNINSELKLSVDSQKKDLFVLKGNRIEIDNSISTTLNNLKKEIEPEIARVLLG